MEIIIIFRTQKQSLRSFKYSGQDSDEFDRLFDKWYDPIYLEDFFKQNEKDLKSGFYGKISIKEAVMLTISEAEELEKQLMGIYDSTDEHPKFLNSLFKPLDNTTLTKDGLEKSKAYGTIEKSIIRLYAIKVPDNSYVITGGAIKLTKTMMESKHTQDELIKMDNCLAYLRNQGIYDEDGLNS